MNTDICKLLYSSTIYCFQNARCIHRQSPYHTCYQVAMVTLFGTKKRKLNVKYTTTVFEIKVRDYSLKIHKFTYHLFLVFISKRGFSSLQTRKSFSEILSGNHRFLRPSIRLVTPYNSAYLITSFTFLRNKSIVF